MNKKPNVLFILSDQHNAKVLGHKGHPDVKTPSLDRMAVEGVRFENAITQNPICTPSRVSWLSGQYCHNHGYYGLSGPHPGGLPTILGHFRRSGYRTAAIGKIHCPEYWVEDDSDVFHETVTDGSIGGRSKEYAAYLKQKGLTNLEDTEALQEFGDLGVQSIDGRPSKVAYEDGQDGWSVKKTISFMEECVKADVPFFAHVSFPRPHQCYTPAKEFWDLYDESRLTLPPNADYDMKDKAPHFRATAEQGRKRKWLFEPKTFEAGRLRKLHGYLGNVSHVDYAVGQLLDWLGGHGLDENTIVVYSSDHGEYACEHGMMEKAPGICSDAVTRIPMIWRWPGHFKAGHIARELVETVDLVNTLCTLARLEALATADGKDITPLLHGDHGEIRKIAVTEFAWSKSVRKGQYRFIYYPREMFADKYPAGFGELYDLTSDPWEMKNLFFDAKYKDIAAELRNDLTEWLITTARPVTIQPPVRKTTSQSSLRYDNAVNADGRIHPDRIRETPSQNYL